MFAFESFCFYTWVKCISLNSEKRQVILSVMQPPAKAILGVIMWRFLSRIFQSAALGKYRHYSCSVTRHVSDQSSVRMCCSMLQKGKSEHPEKEQPRSSASGWRGFHLSAIAPVYIDGSCPLFKAFPACCRHQQASPPTGEPAVIYPVASADHLSSAHSPTSRPF